MSGWVRELDIADERERELADLRARHARALELLAEVNYSGRTPDEHRHPSIPYAEVQVDWETLEKIVAYLAAEKGAQP